MPIKATKRNIPKRGGLMNNYSTRCRSYLISRKKFYCTYRNGSPVTSLKVFIAIDLKI